MGIKYCFMKESANERVENLLRLEDKIDQLLDLQNYSLKLTQSGFLSMHEFATRCGLPVHIVRDACLQLRLAHKKVDSKHIIIPISEMERWIAEAKAGKVHQEKSSAHRNRLILTHLEKKTG